MESTTENNDLFSKVKTLQYLVKRNHTLTFSNTNYLLL